MAGSILKKFQRGVQTVELNETVILLYQECVNHTCEDCQARIG